MTHWSDVYPHDIWTNILVLDGKVIDYKIGNSARDKFSWSIRNGEKEIWDRFDDILVLSFPKSVDNDEEHEQAFDLGRKIVDSMIKTYGTYL